MDLATYTNNLQLLLNDQNAQFYSITNLTNFINRARKYVAGKAMCCRVLTPSSGPISTTITIGSGGSGYSVAPTVTFSAPDALAGPSYTTATGTATIGGGQVTGVTVTNAGTGYVNPPTITFTGVGTGATATAANTANYLTTTVGQEVYQFSTANTIIAASVPGADKLIGIASVSVNIGSTKPTLDFWDFPSFQAYARSANWGQNNPAIWSQYGQGETGSLYVFPVPSARAQMEWDCFVVPLDLSVSQTVDLIPEPWSEAVIYYAAYLAYLYAQRKDDANTMMSESTRLMLEYRQFVTPPRFPTMYPTVE